MSEKAEWVEIIEPITKNIMFANIKTGECCWDTPDESVLSINEQAISSGTIQHQWWELFDVKSSRFFYYNDRTSETTWQKPKDKNVIILPLSKFQLGQSGELRTKVAAVSSSPSKSNPIKLTSTGEVVLKRDSSTQTNKTNVVCFNVATQTTQFDEQDNKDTSFSFSSYIDQFDQMTNRSNRSNVSTKSNLSNKSNKSNLSNKTSSTNNSNNNCRSLKDYLLSEAKFAGVYDNKQYWRGNQEISDEDDRFRMKNKNRFLDNSGDSSSTDLEADDEDNDDSDCYLNQDQESCEDEGEDYDEEETNDEDYSNDNLNDDSEDDFSSDDLADYFKNGDNLGLETKVRLQKMLSSQLDKQKRLSKHKKNAFKHRFNDDEDDQFNKLDDEDDVEILNSMNSFKKNKSKKDPNDYLETTSFIFLNKAATFDSSDDVHPPAKPAPLKRFSSKQQGDLDLPDHQATIKQSGMIILPNHASSVADKAEIVDPTRNLRDKIVDVADLLKRKELPSKPSKKKEAKKKEKKENKPKPPKRANSLDISTTKSSKEKKSSSVKNEELEKFAKENIKRHLKKGGLNQVFKRKESLKGMLVWTKQSIKQPMIATLLNDNELKQEAIDCFRLIQTYCGDREVKTGELSRTSTMNENMMNSTSLTLNSLSSFGTGDSLSSKDAQLQNRDIAFRLIDCAITRGAQIKDEIFIQLCRQTTENPSEESEYAGLQLLTLCLYYFTASNKFSPYLHSFLSNHKSEFARTVCLRKFKKRMDLSIGGTTNSNSYCKRPQDSSEIQMVVEAINKGIPGIFGESLEELMKTQSKRWPDRKLPWILVTLCETILRLGGNEQEGIFRIAGDVEEMNFLKLYLDCLDFEKYAETRDFIDILNSWKYVSSGGRKDIVPPIDVHSIACVLKQWFRELPTPLLPYDLYELALDCSDNPAKATEIIETKLPPINKLVFGYLIRFLQVFCAQQNVIRTKMDDSNVSMVFAPNLIKQQKSNLPTDPSEIFDNTRREMSFIRTLIQNLNTSFIQGVI